MSEQRQISKNGRQIIGMLNANFFYGLAFAFSFMGFFQDLIGKEQYLAYVEWGWVEIHPIIWLIPMLFFLLMSEASKGRIK